MYRIADKLAAAPSACGRSAAVAGTRLPLNYRLYRRVALALASIEAMCPVTERIWISA